MQSQTVVDTTCHIKMQTTIENTTIIAAEVAELLSKGAVVETQLSPNSYVSQIFLAEKKKDGG